MQYRPEYLPQLLSDLASQGINALLVEYEDVFPFEGLDITYDKSTRWSIAQLHDFLATARFHNIEVIPFQQGLGHLEYLLRWERYRPLSLEPDGYPGTFDIDNPDAKALVHEMLRQVIAAHPDSRFVHVGLDEAHALSEYARLQDREPLDLYLDYLEELCALCERYGKTPIIFTDMIQDHISPRSLCRLKKFTDRVVLNPWDYAAHGQRIAQGRFAGLRFSKDWLGKPESPSAPIIGPETQFIEDLPADIRLALEPYLDGVWFKTLFQVDFLAGMGFCIIGTTAVRVSSDGPVMPFYNRRMANITAWCEAAERNATIGVIATSWARGNTFCPPNFCPDLCWPLIGEFCDAMGTSPAPFFKGIAKDDVTRIMRILGRCREDWDLAEQTADEMDLLAEQLQVHRFEWESLALMVRVLHQQRQADFVLSEVELFESARPTASEWRRRLREQDEMLGKVEALQSRVRKHFAKRYYGETFEEWIGLLFNRHRVQLQAYRRKSLEHLAYATRRYANLVETEASASSTLGRVVPIRSAVVASD